MAFQIEIKTEPEPPFQASKWLKLPVLLDTEEMENLLNFLGEFKIFLISRVFPLQEWLASKEKFLKTYAAYIQALKNGKLLINQDIKDCFSSIFTTQTDVLYALRISQDQEMLRLRLPVVQLQHHRFDFSSHDGEFRSMVMGADTVSWGVMFSYPQLFQDNSGDIIKVHDNAPFCNTGLFKRIQQWMRQHTMPTPFLINDKVIRVPIRIGKGCLKWVNNHPQLIQKGLKVKSI